MPEPEQHYFLAVFYQHGRDPRIQKGADGYRDYFTKEQLQKAAWSLMQSGQPECGLYHADGTVGRGQIVESFTWPDGAPDWPMTAVDGTQVVVKAGDWLGKVLPDAVSWDLYERGLISGMSIQGAGRRVKRSTRV